MPRLFLILSLAMLGVSGCTKFRELDHVVSEQSRRADYPALLPIEQILNGVDTVQITPETVSGLSARLARLRTRAARIRRPVLSSRERARLLAAMQRYR